jgi:hypothetical protein
VPLAEGDVVDAGPAPPDGDGEGSGVVTPDAADEAETRPTSPADEPDEPNELLDALTEAWTAARTEGGDGTEKPVPNAEGWSIYWTERPGGTYRDRYVRAPDDTIFRSLTQIRHVVELRRDVVGGGQPASDVDQADAPAGDDLADANVVAEDVIVDTPTPTGDNRADVAVGQKLSVCWETMPDGGLRVLLHGVEPEGTLQWFEAEVKEAGLGRDGYTLFYPVDEKTFNRQTLNGEGRIVYTLVE